jgi:uncharacterized membrane protein
VPPIKFTPKKIAVVAVTAAMYAALTFALMPLAYGGVQFRVSEILNLLVFINPVFAPGIVTGCFIVNLLSEIPFDFIIGTLATVITVLCIIKFSPNLFIASLYPTVVNSVIVGLELTAAFAEQPTFVSFLLMAGSVAIGEFTVMTVVGYPIFGQLMKNEKFMKVLKDI